MSTATVAIMTLSLLVFIGLILANAVTGGMVDVIKDKIDIGVYFKTNTAEDQILNVKQSLERLSEVRAVEYISSDRALELFKEKHKDEPAVLQSLEELRDNPFQPYLNIKAHDPSKYQTIASYLEADELKQYIDDIDYNKNQVVIENLISLIGNVNRIGLTVTIILSLIAGLVVYNTIRLVIYSNRDEIGIMRAVGASNVLVRGPYVVEGVITGVISALLSLLVIFLFFVIIPAVYNSPTYFDVTFPGFDMGDYFANNLGKLLGYQLLFGVGVAVASSIIAVRRYLKN